MQNKSNILIRIVQNYPMQQDITRMPVSIVPTEKGKLSIAIIHTKVVNCYCWIQKLSQL